MQPATQEDFDLQVAKALVAINAPFRAIDNEELRRALSMTAHGLRIPRSPKISRIVTGFVEQLETNLLKDMVAGSKLSIAYDCWTSPNNYAFLAVVGYFIDKDWKLREVLLGFEHLVGRHIGRNLGDKVYDVLVRYGVQDRVQAITTDNASNNGTAVSYLRSFVRGTTITYHIPCLAHVLQLSLGAMLATLKASPAIETEVDVWNDDLVSAVRQQTGFAHVIEKVSHVIVFPFNYDYFFFFAMFCSVLLGKFFFPLVTKNCNLCECKSTTCPNLHRCADGVPSSGARGWKCGW